MDKDFDQICEYILKLKRAELFLHGIKQQDKTKARLYHAMLEYYDAGILRCWNTTMLLIKKKDI